MGKLRAPFPYFGGKSNVANIIWYALGDVKHYIEPFFGSGAVLLSRPNYHPTSHLETINDKDGFIANVWRSLKFDPNEVAKWCDWPVNHADLTARRKELIKNEQHLLKNLISDPDWYDPILAGYWIWGASCWIGRGFTTKPKKTTNTINRIPHLSHSRGVHRTTNTIGQRPHLTGNAGVHTKHDIYVWFEALSDRLRHVQVTCGDYACVLGGNWQNQRGLCGIFFDPPYGTIAQRDTRIYHVDNLTIAQNVAKWSLARGKDPSYRIVLAGYFDEHKWLLNHGWTFKKWSASGGYSKRENKNRHKETLFFSPHCNIQKTFEF